MVLTPCSEALGAIVNEGAPWKGTLFGRRSIVNVETAEDGRLELPAGEWQLLSYTIDLTGQTKEEPVEKSALERLGDLLGSSDEGQKLTTVSARVPSDSAPIEVVAGEAVELPFGPPFRPQVQASRSSGSKVSLRLAILGRAGEACTGLYVDGKRPPEPEFVITDPAGKVVKRGEFEYG